jgi:hypothetical protein
LKNILIITNSKLLKNKKDESANNLAAIRLIVYNSNMKVS